MLKKSIILISFIFVMITSSACVYRQDIHQGNRIDQDKLTQLKIGMSRKQVNFLLGQPAINDPYHNDQWVYLYFLKNGDRQEIEQRVLTLEFRDGKLMEIDGSLEQS